MRISFFSSALVFIVGTFLLSVPVYPTIQFAYADETQFQITSVTLDKVDALGNTAEDVRSFGISVSHPVEKITISLWESPNISILHDTPYLTTTIQGNETLKSFYMSPGEWFSKKLKPNTTYTYEVKAWKRGASADMNTGYDRQFTTSNFTAAADTQKTETKKTEKTESIDVRLTSSKSLIKQGESTVLTWFVTNADTCTASGPNWTGTKNPLGGSEAVVPSEAVSLYALSCHNSTKQQSAMVEIDVESTVNAENPAPTVEFISDATSLQKGATVSLSWKTNADVCQSYADVLQEDNTFLWDMNSEWASSGLTRLTNGSAVVRPAITTKYFLNCALSGKQTVKTVIISVDGKEPDNKKQESTSTVSAGEKVGQSKDIDTQLADIEKKTQLIADKRYDDILAELKQLRSVVKEQESEIKYLQGLTQDVKSVNEQTKSALTQFITYGVDANSEKLGAGERAAVAYSYKTAYSKLPETDADLSDMIKIANGRYPSERNADAEKKAIAVFKQLYKRVANLKNNKNDTAAVMVMAYGLRQAAEHRNLNSERRGIEIFKGVYGKVPQTTEEWNIMQAITYSGATRKPDTDKDLLADQDEKQFGTDPGNPDTDGDGFIDGLEIENYYNPLNPNDATRPDDVAKWLLPFLVSKN
ncbi:hypothetical protein HY732_02215 [Candidatus Uhrbacteria bacterium]|nr:hypothetical protein [Candidatus Uhrbacteria bacterium]